MSKAGYELLNEKKYDPLIAELIDRLGMEATATTWLNAEAWLDLLMASAPPMIEGERQLVEGSILPTCAIYFAMRAALGKDEAYELLRRFMRDEATAKGRRLGKVFAVPGVRHLAMLGARGEALSRYGSTSGFGMTLLESDSSHLCFEVHACPFVRWCEICDASDIASLFCDNDDYAYGSLRGLCFRREGTLARGADHCDFDFKLR